MKNLSSPPKKASRYEMADGKPKVIEVPASCLKTMLVREENPKYLHPEQLSTLNCMAEKNTTDKKVNGGKT